MTPRTLDVPELSTIRPTETLRDWRRRVHPHKARRLIIRRITHVLIHWR